MQSISDFSPAQPLEFQLQEALREAEGRLAFLANDRFDSNSLTRLAVHIAPPWDLFKAAHTAVSDQLLS